MRYAHTPAPGEAVSRRAFLGSTSTALALIGAGSAAMASTNEGEAVRLDAAIERHRSAAAAYNESAKLGDNTENEFEGYERENPTPFETSIGTMFYPTCDSIENSIVYSGRTMPKAILAAWQRRRDDTIQRIPYMRGHEKGTFEEREEESRRRWAQRDAENKRSKDLFEQDLAAFDAARDRYDERRMQTGINEIDLITDDLALVEQEAFSDLLAMPLLDRRNAFRKVSYLLGVKRHYGMEERWRRLHIAPHHDLDAGNSVSLEQSALAVLLFSLVGGQANA